MWGGGKRLASAISWHSRSIIGNVLGRPVCFVGRQSAKPWTFAVFAALSPLIDTSQMWVAFAQILPLAMRIRWSLSLIFLDFKCVTMWIWRGWFRWDVHHAVSRDFWRWWQLRHSLPRQSYPACLLRVYHHLTDDVGASTLLRFPLHWRTRNGQCVSYLYYRPFFTRGSKVLPLFFLCKVSARWEQWQNEFWYCRAVAWLDEEKLAWSGFAARARFSYHKKNSEKDVRSSALFPSPWR